MVSSLSLFYSYNLRELSKFVIHDINVWMDRIAGTQYVDSSNTGNAETISRTRATSEATNCADIFDSRDDLS